MCSVLFRSCLFPPLANSNEISILCAKTHANSEPLQMTRRCMEDETTGLKQISLFEFSPHITSIQKLHKPPILLSFLPGTRSQPNQPKGPLTIPRKGMDSGRHPCMTEVKESY